MVEEVRSAFISGIWLGEALGIASVLIAMAIAKWTMR